MGVPTFYKWLCTRYPQVVKNVIEEKEQLVNGEFIPVNLTDKNPNGEYDCLYLDMNGIIHPCCHPENASNPESEDEMFNNIFDYIDRILSIVRPRKLLYMAIDGVAPRAKMNQQRMRRFKAANEAEMEETYYEELHQQFTREGRNIPPRKVHWDSNVITPGTPFMHKLSLALRYYIEDRIHCGDRLWKNIKIFLSDSNTPGEGEHKIMQFIRSNRLSKSHNPNLCHVLYGADADLIMLGLCTHEVNFSIIREIVTEGGDKLCDYCKQTDHTYSNCPSLKNGVLPSETSKVSLKKSWKELQFLQLVVLREYLQHDFKFTDDKLLPFSYDFERCVDDFVFMCFFCGNDFLPHLPSLAINKGSIDQMLLLYQNILPSLGDYLTKEGELNRFQVSKFISFLGKVENEVFKQDLRRKYQMKEREEANKRLLESQKANGEDDDLWSNNMKNAVNAICCGTANNEGAELRHGNTANENIALVLKKQLEGNEESVKDILNSSVKSESSKSNESVAFVLKRQLELKIESRAPDNVVARHREGKLCAGHRSINLLRKNSSSGGIAKSDEDLSLAKRESESFAEENLKEEPLARPESEKIDVEDTEEEEELQDEIIKAEDIIEDKIEKVIAKVVKENLAETLIDRKDLKNETYDKPIKAIASQLQRDYDDFKEKLNAKLKSAKEIENPLDDIKLGEGNRNTWRDKYYKTKFHLLPDDNVEDFVRELCLSYIEGLCWVLRYYYQGCASWSWFFFYHYAPFASDIHFHLQHSFNEPSFVKGTPFKPFDQLMAVLPAHSAHCLPSVFSDLMKNHNSPISDFYPRKFKEDPDGKKYKWQWVILLPFIDEERLIRTLRPLEKYFTAEEAQRNELGNEYIFVHESHSFATHLHKMYNYNQEEKSQNSAMNEEFLIEEEFCDGVRGKIKIDIKTNLPGTFVQPLLRNRKSFCSTSISCIYISPPKQHHQSILLSGAKTFSPILSENDLYDESRKCRRFNGGAARRMIMNCLGLVFNQPISQNLSNNMYSGRIPACNDYVHNLSRGGGSQAVEVYMSNLIMNNNYIPQHFRHHQQIENRNALPFNYSTSYRGRGGRGEQFSSPYANQCFSLSEAQMTIENGGYYKNHNNYARGRGENYFGKRDFGFVSRGNSYEGGKKQRGQERYIGQGGAFKDNYNRYNQNYNKNNFQNEGGTGYNNRQNNHLRRGGGRANNQHERNDKEYVCYTFNGARN